MPLLPITEELHIGAEIECFTDNVTYGDARELVREMGLSTILEVGTDGSIIHDYADGDEDNDEFDDLTMELRFLTTSTNLERNLGQLKQFLQRIGAMVNSSCGLHVHLDARGHHIPKINVYRNLIKHQRDLFQAVQPRRRTNRYCRPIPTVKRLREIINGSTHHYDGISYDPSNTIEIRMHHGSVDVENEIAPWLMLISNLGFTGKLLSADKKYLKRKAIEYGDDAMSDIPNLIYRSSTGLYLNSLRVAK